ncbi:hypothetical protein [Actinokineospora bangkokensis]|uniref:Uncharacterized protein n=1 Tax=Actinokineospora bangkokensis TaxID=1193682 RepID=A0A1Q9LFA9_9PSEU|nr:hypothetical protein [Actinokineospora bangkokensis]OLR90727.1 hypothetical protein BJP25_29480 [Actinokineospora bangkokensis]
MIYLLAAVGAVTVAVLLWRALGPQPPAGVAQRRSSSPVAPDDDPEFLRGLNKYRPGPDTGDEGKPPAP